MLDLFSLQSLFIDSSDTLLLGLLCLTTRYYEGQENVAKVKGLSL